MTPEEYARETAEVAYRGKWGAKPQFISPTTMTPTPPKTILDEAKEIIYGDREQTYGEPDKNFKTIATFWYAYCKNRFGKEVNFGPRDVAYMMALLKLARLANDPSHRDSAVDGAGYLAAAERCK